MTGTILNVSCILIGGAIGLTARSQISEKVQHRIKLAMGAFTIFVGFKMIWDGLNGSFFSVLQQFGILMLSLIVGKLIGQILHLQEGSNKLGQYAKKLITRSGSEDGNKLSEGFMTCTLLFCVGPMAVVGSLQDGLEGKFTTLAIKAVMDGMSTMVFATLFGWGVLLSALPVLAYQGTLTILAQALSQHLKHPSLIDSMNATGGFLVLSIALVILNVKKVELTNYLPSLAIAPLLTYWWLV
jgi:uncharacterized protein